MEFKFVALKQRHIVAWSNGLPAEAGKMRIPAYNSACVESAIKAGWFESPVLKPEDVDEMSPADVRQLAEAVAHEYARAMGVSPE